MKGIIKEKRPVSAEHCYQQTDKGEAQQCLVHPPWSCSVAYRNYIVIVMWLVMLLRFVDLQIVSVVLESIRKAFDVSDTLLGLLTGPAFAIFYGTLGVPIAILADRGNRSRLIAIAVGLWSAMTAVSGLAATFAALVAARIGVGIGEAGGQPPTFSLISDYIPASRRSIAFAILNSAIPAGVFVGFIVGGYVNHWYGWRAAFMIVGVPGVFLAALIGLTVREPVRVTADQARVPIERVPFRTAVRTLFQTHSYRHLVAATSFFTLGAMGPGVWLPSFFIRVHGMSSIEVSRWLAFAYGAGGLVGAVLGGWTADRLSTRNDDQRWQMWISAAATLAILPFEFIVLLWPNARQALMAQFIVAILMYAWMGPAYGAVQSLSNAKYRALAAAINALAVNLLALGLGPLVVGIASDYFKSRLGVDSLRYSILSVVVVFYILAATQFLLAAKTIRRDLRSAAILDAPKSGISIAA